MGAFGCWGLYRLEGMGVHPWVLGTAWVGWALGFFGCRGSPREAGHRDAPLGARDPLGLGGHWVPLGAGVPLGWRVWERTLGCQGPHGLDGSCFSLGAGGPYGMGGHWAAPLGARDSLGLGGCWVPLGAGGPFRLEGVGEHPWVPGTAWVGWAFGFFGCQESPRVAGHRGAPLGARDSLGLGGCWVPLGAGSL